MLSFGLKRTDIVFTTFLPIILLSSAFALSIPPFSSITNDSSFPGTLPNHTVSYPNPPLNVQNECDWQRYGRRLKESSCRNAWDKIGTSGTSHTLFARPRGAGQYAEIPIWSRLPIRYLSDDGVCAIDLRIKSGGRQDTTSSQAVSTAVDLLLRKCVEQDGWGGRRTVACKSDDVS